MKAFLHTAEEFTLQNTFQKHIVYINEKKHVLTQSRTTFNTCLEAIMITNGCLFASFTLKKS